MPSLLSAHMRKTRHLLERHPCCILSRGTWDHLFQTDRFFSFFLQLFVVGFQCFGCLVVFGFFSIVAVIVKLGDFMTV